MANERLPEFDPAAAEHEVHAPSMRPGLSRAWTDLSTEQLIKQTLEEDGADRDREDSPGPEHLGPPGAGLRRFGTT
jgi:hypothetical protein